MVRSQCSLALVAGLVLCLAAGNVPQGQGSTLIVTKKETRLRTQKRALAPAVTTLLEGDKLTLQNKDGVWYQVAYKGQNGWIHSSDCSDRKDVRLSTQGVRETYSASEQSAARKGFNPQVENEHRRKHPDLDKHFTAVDAIQKQQVSDEEVTRFIQEGKLVTGGGR